MHARARSAPGYRHVSVLPLSGALGAEIHDVDLSRPLADEVFAEIHRTLLDYQVIFFRDQRLAPDELIAFAERFGPLDKHTILKGIPGYPEILPVMTEPEDTHVFAEGWHADVTYQERPTLGALLYALEVPPAGGDTLFANQYLAYRSLSAGMRRLLDGLTAIHGAARAYGDRQAEFNLEDDMLMVDKVKARATEAEHPVVRAHPETGRRALFVNDHYTLRFKGMSAEESAPLLRFLFEHAIRPEFTSRFRWQKGSIAFWDNRCTLHCPIPDYRGYRRRMHRVVVRGDRPVHR